MADNIDVTPGSGKTVAADDIGGVLFQRVKVTLGADGVNDADVSTTNPLPVDGSGVTQPVSAASLPLPTGAATATKQDDQTTLLTALASTVVGGVIGVDGSGVTQPVSLAGNQAVNLAQVAGATTVVGHGVAAAALRVELPTDGTGVVGLNAGTNSIGNIAAITGALPAGANVIGALTANQTINLSQVAGATVATGHGTASGAIRVELPTDGTGVLGLNAGTNTIGNISHVATVDAVSGNVATVGPTAQNNAVTAAPVVIAGRAATTYPTNVGDGNVSQVMTTHDGRVVIAHNPRELMASQKTTLSNTTSETTIVSAAGAGIFADVCAIHLANTGGNTTKVDIRDATGGSIIDTIEVPTLETRGFHGSVFLPQTTANGNWTAQCAAVTTAMEVTVWYSKRK